MAPDKVTRPLLFNLAQRSIDSSEFNSRSPLHAVEADVARAERCQEQEESAEKRGKLAIVRDGPNGSGCTQLVINPRHLNAQQKRYGSSIYSQRQGHTTDKLQQSHTQHRRVGLYRPPAKQADQLLRPVQRECETHYNSCYGVNKIPHTGYS